MLHLVTEILKHGGHIYGHQWPGSVGGLMLDNEDTQQASQPICSTIEVEVDTALGLG